MEANNSSDRMLLRGTRPCGRGNISRNFSDTSCSVGEFPLTDEEAFAFLEDVLQISDSRKKMEDNPRNFVNIIAQNMLYRVPFTNLPLLGRESHCVTPPSFLEIKDAMFSRIGGVCVDFTMFTYALLSCIGYDCYICDSTYFATDESAKHCAVVVRNLSHLGSKHLVDTGCGEPFFRSVSLDFEKVSPIYRDDYLTYRFVRQIDGVVLCEKIQQKEHFEDFNTSDTGIKDHTGTSWCSLVTYDVDTPRDLQFLLETYTVPAIPGYFFRSLFVIGFPMGRLHGVFKGASSRSIEDGHIIKTKVEDKEEELDICMKYFPHFPRNMVQTVISNVSRPNLTLKHPGYRRS